MSGVVLAFSTRTPSTRRSWTGRTGQEVDTSPAGAATSEDIEVSFPDDLSGGGKRQPLGGTVPFFATAAKSPGWPADRETARQNRSPAAPRLPGGPPPRPGVPWLRQ